MKPSNNTDAPVFITEKQSSRSHSNDSYLRVIAHVESCRMERSDVNLNTRPLKLKYTEESIFLRKLTILIWLSHTGFNAFILNILGICMPNKHKNF